jgi:hypothetical protein
MPAKPAPSSGCASHDIGNEFWLNWKKFMFTETVNPHFSNKFNFMQPTNIRLLFTTIQSLAFALLTIGATNAALAQPPALADSRVWRYLTTDLAVSVAQGWGETRTDASVSGRTISIAGQSYEKGLGTHAPGELVFKLDRRHKQFFAEVGVDDQGGPTGSVLFKVLCDGKEAFNSSVMKFGQAAKPITLDVTGVAELRLVVTDGGDGVQGDHADWANAAVDDVAEVIPVRTCRSFRRRDFLR